MCGILSINFNQNSAFDMGKIYSSLQSLKHRGPDEEGIWISEDNQHLLGHRRLSIIDLNSGTQPISNELNDIHIVVNGELYEYEKIRDQLIRNGHKFKTKTDSEIILHLYDELGTLCLHELRGEFAFVIYDERNKRVFAARDRFGVKPLFYSFYNGTLYLASEIKALLALGIPVIWNQEEYYSLCNLMFHQSGQDKTLFKGIYQLPPSHYLIATEQNYNITQYWDLAGNQQTIRPNISEEEIVENVRELLLESVSIRLKADVPVACYMSGGIDSSTVAGIAAKLSSTPIHGYTISFDHEDYDELKFTKEMAEFSNTTLHSIKVTDSDIADYFSKAVYHTESIFWNPQGVSKLILSEYVHRNNIKVILNGEGGDELFAGYASFISDYILHESNQIDKLELKTEIDELTASNKISSGSLLPDGLEGDIEIFNNCFGFTPTWIKAPFSPARKIIGLMNNDFSSQFSQDSIYRNMLNGINTQFILRHSPLEVSMWLWSKYFLPFHILGYEGDRTEMANSIEGRPPLLDHKLAEYMWQVPVHLKLKNLQDKYILRQAAKPFVTDSLFRRKKHPFIAPPMLLNENSRLYEMASDIFHSQKFKSIPFYDQKKVLNMIERAKDFSFQEKVVIDNVLCLLLSTYFLQENFNLSYLDN